MTINQGVYFRIILRQSFFQLHGFDKSFLESMLRRMGFFISWHMPNPNADELRQVNLSVANLGNVRKALLGEHGSLAVFCSRFAPYIEEMTAEVYDCPDDIQYSYGCREISAPRSWGYKLLLRLGRISTSDMTCIITQGKATLRLNVSHRDDGDEGIKQFYYALGELHYALSSLNQCRLIHDLIKGKRQYNGAAREAKQYADKVQRQLAYQPI